MHKMIHLVHASEDQVNDLTTILRTLEVN